MVGGDAEACRDGGADAVGLGMSVGEGGEVRGEAAGEAWWEGMRDGV